jgi:uncharacterized protein with HEPN domain
MTRHDTEVTLRQILSYAKEAVNLLLGKEREDLDQDRLLNLALSRLIEIIGEAANRVPDEVQIKYPQLPWLQMRGARNRLIHGYDSVDFDIMWAIVKDDLPVLIAQLEAIFDYRTQFCFSRLKETGIGKDSFKKWSSRANPKRNTLQSQRPVR